MAARYAVESMADELGLPRSKAVTTIKPSGTLSKVMDTTEGIHMPMGKYIFNNVRFGKHDPMVKQLKKAHYRVFNDPTSLDAVLVTFPVAYEGVQFTEVNGVEVNLESALEQLERYKRVMENYVDHNCSITVSYDLDEVPAIVDWLLENWDTYVGVSFIYRNDPTKTAKDLGYLYLPQEVVTKEVYDEYVKGLLPLTFAASGAKEVDHDWEIDTGEECAGGVCPIR
jgi:ribonucleoside-triphosphate reductase